MLIAEVIFLNEKQREIWKSAALSIVELLILVMLCNLNAHSFSLGYGGEKVAALQKALKQSGAYDGRINGLFDLETKNAVRNLFPESRGEADCDVLEKLGLDCRCCGFSASSDLMARYISFRMDDMPVCSIRMAIAENRISGLMRSEPDFLCSLKKIEPSSEACDCAYKMENNK